MNGKHTKTQILSLALITILGTLPTMSLAGAQWTYLTDMPTPRSVLSASVVEGKIHAMGGKIMPYRPNTTSSVVEAYDPMTNQWSQKADMLIPRANFSTSVVDGKIYAIGGYTGRSGGSGPPRSSVDVYDPATNAWSQITGMPIAEADHSSATVDGKIYVMGGNTVQIYDPLTDTWTRGADRPSTPRWWAPVSVVDGKIYSIGGAKGPPTYQVVPTVEEYDPATDTWTAKTDIHTATASHASVVVDGRIYIINGNGVGGPVLSLVQVYDPVTDTWMEGPRTLIARQLPCAALVNGTIYLMGGFDGAIDRLASYGAVEALDLNPVADFNADGAIDIDDLVMLIESWDIDDPSVDIGPMPWGDAIIDSRDLLVLAEHMVEYENLANDLQASRAMRLFGQPSNPSSGRGGGGGTSTGWNYIASLSGGSWDGVTVKQIWAVDGAANLGGGTIQIRDSAVYETTSLGIGADVIYSNGQAMGTGPVIAGYQVTGLTVFVKTDEVTGEVYELELLFIAPETGNKHALHATVGVVETGVIPGEYAVTLTPNGPSDIRLDEWVKGKRVNGPVVDTGYGMGAIEYTPLEAL